MTEEKPFYAHHVFCCDNERPPGHKRGCCMEKSAEPLRKYMKSRAKELGIDSIRINGSGCLDRCELGPVMVIYPEGTWYTYANFSDIDEILTKHVQGGTVVERLVLKNGQENLTPAQAQHLSNAMANGFKG